MKISFKKRTERGKKNKKIRLEGLIPVVCYGVGKTTEHYSISEKEFSKFLKEDSIILNADGDLSGQSIIVQDIDRNPVTDEVRHIDFLYVDETHKVEHTVSLEFVGDAPALRKGCFVERILSEVVTKSLPQNIPSKIVIDLSKIENVGQHLKVSDIPPIPNVEILTSPDEIIVSVTEQKEVEEEEVTSEEIDFSKIETTTNKGSKDDVDAKEEETEEEKKK